MSVDLQTLATIGGGRLIGEDGRCLSVTGKLGTVYSRTWKGREEPAGMEETYLMSLGAVPDNASRGLEDVGS